MNIITLAWGEIYIHKAYGLLCSARRFSVPLTTIEISGEPKTPQEAKRMKPGLLRNFLRIEPVVWLDADSHIHKIPKLFFNDMNADIGLYNPHENEWWNGTMMLNPTEKTFKILDIWEDRLRGDDWDLDQKVLSEIIVQEKPEIFSLPFSYHWMDDVHRPLGLPIIEQYGIGVAKNTPRDQEGIQ